MNNQQQNHNTPIHLPGKNNSDPYGDGNIPEIDLPSADNASPEIPWNFQEMILKFNQSFNNLQMQKSSLSVIDKELFLCRRWESNPIKPLNFRYFLHMCCILCCTTSKMVLLWL